MNKKINILSIELNTLNSSIKKPNKNIEKFESIESFFNTRKLTIINKMNYDDINNKILEIAYYIGKNHSHLHTTLEYFRSHWGNGKNNFSIPYKNYTGMEKTHLFELCQKIETIDEINYFRDDKYHKNIHIYVNDNSKDVSFLNGQWLEYYLGYRLYSLLQNSWNKNNFEIIFNVCYQNGTGIQHEIDVFLLLDGIPYLFEAKSGKSTGDIINQIKNHLKILKLKKDRHVVILTKFAEKDARKIKENNKQQVIFLNSFDDSVNYWFKENNLKKYKTIQC